MSSAKKSPGAVASKSKVLSETIIDALFQSIKPGEDEESEDSDEDSEEEESEEEEEDEEQRRRAKKAKKKEKKEKKRQKKKKKKEGRRRRKDYYTDEEEEEEQVDHEAANRSVRKVSPPSGSRSRSRRVEGEDRRRPGSSSNKRPHRDPSPVWHPGDDRLAMHREEKRRGSHSSHRPDVGERLQRLSDGLHNDAHSQPRDRDSSLHSRSHRSHEVDDERRRRDRDRIEQDELRRKRDEAKQKEKERYEQELRDRENERRREESRRMEEERERREAGERRRREEEERRREEEERRREEEHQRREDDRRRKDEDHRRREESRRMEDDRRRRERHGGGEGDHRHSGEGDHRRRSRSTSKQEARPPVRREDDAFWDSTWDAMQLQKKADAQESKGKHFLDNKRPRDRTPTLSPSPERGAPPARRERTPSPESEELQRLRKLKAIQDLVVKDDERFVADPPNKDDFEFDERTRMWKRGSID